MHDIYQISFAARVAMLAANLVIFLILANHTRNRHISEQGSGVFWLLVSFAGTSFATSCVLAWGLIITIGIIQGTPHPEWLLSNVITLSAIIMMIFGFPLIRVLTLPSRTVWFSGAFISISALIGYLWAGEYL